MVISFIYISRDLFWAVSVIDAVDAVDIKRLKSGGDSDSDSDSDSDDDLTGINASLNPLQFQPL